MIKRIDALLNKWSLQTSLPKSFIVLACILAVVAFIGCAFAIVIFLVTGFYDSAFDRALCLKNSCIEEASKIYSQVIAIIGSTVSLLAAIATIGGILLALLSYLNSVSVSALGNHISHFTVFQAYLMAEISKRQLVSPRSIDIYKWYRTIFDKSRLGITTVSEQYIACVENVAGEIKKSNGYSRDAKGGSFRYVDHQERMIKALVLIGIQLERNPRTDFFQVEREVFELIGSVNAAFCYAGEAGDLPDIKYY
ncbi:MULTISPECIES: retron Ec48 family effector membrane protein [Lysobacter]|uniref:retron Ec48 family effector membrane protein n=1 Tax=Lysobacter TaxID=68 RepID=UPI001F1B5B4E|nr:MULTISPECIES: retron Ec48 family effector membrane protein [Lysobacter]UJB18504.1 retron Ec48 family effector membrane protein [Lysobacter capsici]UJQ27771.1 retron Ec48 family effector membrane protein [Lysobacter gummosus]